jgi:hypothetical protein
MSNYNNQKPAEKKTYTKEERKALNARQILKKYDNGRSLLDVVDHIDTLSQEDGKEGEFNKKILLIVNNYKDQYKKPTGKKQETFYWDIDEALYIAEDIVNGTFKNQFYGQTKDRVDENGKVVLNQYGKPEKDPIIGAYSKHGGKTVSRALNIMYKDGTYGIQIAIYKAIPGKNGVTLPDRKNPLGLQTVQIPEFELRRIMRMIINQIEMKTIIMNMPQFGQAQEQAPEEEEVVIINDKTEAPKENVQEFLPDPSELDIFDGMGLFGNE